MARIPKHIPMSLGTGSTRIDVLFVIKAEKHGGCFIAFQRSPYYQSDFGSGFYRPGKDHWEGGHYDMKTLREAVEDCHSRLGNRTIELTTYCEVSPVLVKDTVAEHNNDLEDDDPKLDWLKVMDLMTDEDDLQRAVEDGGVECNDWNIECEAWCPYIIDNNNDGSLDLED